MKLFTRLTITCQTNPDFEGIFKSADIGEEMDDMGLVPSGNNWIEYVMGHFDFPAEVDDMVCNDMVLNLKCDIGGHVVEFVKK